MGQVWNGRLAQFSLLPTGERATTGGAIRDAFPGLEHPPGGRS
jgi:hypothetical protein